MPKLIPSLFKVFVLVLLLCRPVHATWSIIIINLRTGEIAIGSATCVANYDLRVLASILVVGKGAAAAQSYIDFTGKNRLLLFNGLKQGLSPSAILVALANQDPGHQMRQYGIVDTKGRSIGFTGNQAGAWAGHLTGKIGDLVYAIQGNVLTGQPVITAAEQAVRNTKGDLATKLMAAMQAARAKGGDGRCSCPNSTPTACGSPPQNFTKSAHIGYMVVARPGDKDGTCGTINGCANGIYYMKLDVVRGSSAPDPVGILQGMFNSWRVSWLGRPDHFMSAVSVPTNLLPADGKTAFTVDLVLSDWTGNQLTIGGAKVAVAFGNGNPLGLKAGTVTDHGNGVYTFEVIAGTRVGTTDLRVTVDDGKGGVLLSPAPRLTLTSDKLWVSRDTSPVTSGGNLVFVLNQGAANNGKPYLLLGSISGTTPGIKIGGLTFPLNFDSVLWAIYLGAGTNSLPGFLGNLDASGRQVVKFTFPRGSYGLPMGTDLHFASGILSPLGSFTNPVKVRLVR